jgi:hypothetical protein
MKLLKYYRLQLYTVIQSYKQFYKIQIQRQRKVQRDTCRQHLHFNITFDPIYGFGFTTVNKATRKTKRSNRQSGKLLMFIKV